MQNRAPSASKNQTELATLSSVHTQIPLEPFQGHATYPLAKERVAVIGIGKEFNLRQSPSARQFQDAVTLHRHQIGYETAKQGVAVATWVRAPVDRRLFVLTQSVLNSVSQEETSSGQPG